LSMSSSKSVSSAIICIRHTTSWLYQNKTVQLKANEKDQPSKVRSARLLCVIVWGLVTLSRDTEHCVSANEFSGRLEYLLQSSVSKHLIHMDVLTGRCIVCGKRLARLTTVWFGFSPKFVILEIIRELLWIGTNQFASSAQWLSMQFPTTSKLNSSISTVLGTQNRKEWNILGLWDHV
jgi:hypothetical protein